MYKSVYLEGVWQIPESQGLFGKSRKMNSGGIDGSDLAQQIEGACNEFERNGYSIVSIVPKVNSYAALWLFSGAGMSYTAGAVIVARKAD